MYLPFSVLDVHPVTPVSHEFPVASHVMPIHERRGTFLTLHYVLIIAVMEHFMKMTVLREQCSTSAPVKLALPRSDGRINYLLELVLSSNLIP